MPGFLPTAAEKMTLYWAMVRSARLSKNRGAPLRCPWGLAPPTTPPFIHAPTHKGVLPVSLTFTVSPLSIPLKVSFKHASAERSVGESLWVTISRNGRTGRGEGCPRFYVTGETLDGALGWARATLTDLCTQEMPHLNALSQWVHAHATLINQNPAAWCAIELAFCDLFAQESRQSLPELFGITPLKASYFSAVVSDGDTPKVTSHLLLYLRLGFRDFKFKLSGDVENDQQRFLLFRSLVDRYSKDLSMLPARLWSYYTNRSAIPFTARFDGNNVWAGSPHKALSFLESLGEQRPLGLEEPLAPRDYTGLSGLSTKTGCAIILDESLTSVEDLAEAFSYAGTWIPNIRVSKVGGLIRSLALVECAKKKGAPIIVGAQVGETSLLTRAAHVVASAAGEALLAQEGAFGERLLQRDPVRPPLQFGFGGKLVW